jgi:hypothetical protein
VEDHCNGLLLVCVLHGGQPCHTAMGQLAYLPGTIH